MFKKRFHYLSADSIDSLIDLVEQTKADVKQEIKFGVPIFANGEWYSLFEIDENTYKAFFEGKKKLNKSKSKPKI